VAHDDDDDDDDDDALRIISTVCLLVCLFSARQPHWVGASSFTRFLDQAKRRTTVVTTPLDE